MIGLAEHLVGQLAPEGFEQRDFLGGWLAFRHHVGILEVRCRALVRAEHDVGVRPFEIEQQPERLANAPVPELVAADIEEPALRARRGLVGDGIALDPALAHGGNVVGGRPVAGGELFAERDRARLEALERHLPVAVIFVAKPVEIILPRVHQEIPGPVVRHAGELDEAALLEFRDLVCARAERGLERGLLEGPARIVGLREDRQLSDGQRQVAERPFS